MPTFPKTDCLTEEGGTIGGEGAGGGAGFEIGGGNATHPPKSISIEMGVEMLKAHLFKISKSRR